MDEGTTHRVDAEAMRSLYVQTPAILAGNAVGVFLVLAIFWPFADPTSMSVSYTHLRAHET